MKIDFGFFKIPKVVNLLCSTPAPVTSSELNSKLNIEADFSSKSAIQKVEKAGGSILVKSNKD